MASISRFVTLDLDYCAVLSTTQIAYISFTLDKVLCVKKKEKKRQNWHYSVLKAFIKTEIYCLHVY